MSHRYRSLFWPIVLIGIGLVWLLSNLNFIQPVTIESLLRLWPILLIVVGLDMLIGRRSPWLGGMIGLIAVGAVVFILAFGPALGLTIAARTTTERITEPIGEAKAAQVSLWLADRPAVLRSLSDSNALLDATLTYEGVLNFDVSGTTYKEVSLSRSLQGSTSFVANGDWQIGLTPEIPLDVWIDGGSGSAELDLSQLDLQSFQMDVGSGMVRLSLPAVKQPYQAEIEGGSGSLELNLAQGAHIKLILDTGSGMVNVRVPRDAAVRVEVQDSGSGLVTLRAELERLNGTGDEGVWQTPGYSLAEKQIEIVVTDLGSGNLDVR